MAVSVVLDTNVVLYHLANRLAADLPEGPICVSVISEIELLSYPGLASAEEKQIEAFLAKVNVIELSDAVKREAIKLRKTRKLKLPDAIVAATAKTLAATLLTNDKALSSVSGLTCVVPKLAEQDDVGGSL